MVLAQAASATAAAVGKQHNRMGVLWQPQGAVECYWVGCNVNQTLFDQWIGCRNHGAILYGAVEDRELFSHACFCNHACLSPDAWVLNCPQDIARSSNG